jgi:hypothetical protein
MELICEYCNNVFKSRQSRCNHIRKFHKLNNNTLDNTDNTFDNTFDNTLQKSKKTENNKIIKKYNCRNCDKEFNNYQNRWKHEKICGHNKNNKNDKLLVIMDKVLKMLEDNKNIDNIPSSINNSNNTINNSNNIINNNQNNITNNITLVKFGDEKLTRILTDKDMRRIINQNQLSIEESIKTVHFNKDYPEYNNIFITNMRDDTAYIFDGSKFISIHKNGFLNELFNLHKDNLELYLEDAKIDDKKLTKINKFLEALNDNETKFNDYENNKVYPNYKAYKLNKIKRLIYNESDTKVLKNYMNKKIIKKVYSDSESDEIEV